MDLERHHEKRVEKLQALMIEEGVDLALVMVPVNVYYFSNTAQKGVLFIPSTGEPVFYVLRAFERALEECVFKCVETDGLTILIEEAKKLKPKVVGIEESYLPVRVYRRLSSIECRFEDVGRLILELRKVKDELELELMKGSARLCDLALSRIRDLLEEGITEVELAAKVELELRKAGHDGYLDSRSFGDRTPNIAILFNGSIAPTRTDAVASGQGLSNACPVGSGNVKLKYGGIVWADVGGRLKGYTTNVSRTFSFRKVDKEVEDVFDALRKIYLKILGMVRSGVDGKEIYFEAVKLAEEMGCKEGFMGRGGGKVFFIGHGIGLEVDEPPAIGEASVKLVENMTLALEPKIVLPSRRGVALESTLVVKEDGCEVLDKFPIDLLVV